VYVEAVAGEPYAVDVENLTDRDLMADIFIDGPFHNPTH
jgi:hypothetical protein